MKINLQLLIAEAVERGVTLGWRHAHKHTDDPTEESACDQITMDVMNELCEYVDFGTAEIVSACKCYQCTEEEE